MWKLLVAVVDRSTESEALGCIQKSETAGNSVPPISLTSDPDYGLTLDASFDNNCATKPTIDSGRP